MKPKNLLAKHIKAGSPELSRLSVAQLAHMGAAAPVRVVPEIVQSWAQH